MEFPVTVPLKRQIEHGDEIYPVLEFDEPDLATTIAVEEEENPMQQTVILLAGMAGVDRGVILKLKERDFREVTRLVLNPYQAQFLEAEGEAGNAPAAPDA